MARALLDLRNLGRDTDHDARAHPHVAVVRLLDEVGQHLFGDLEVGDDPVLHRLDRDDIARRAPEHLFGGPANRLDATIDLVDRDDGRFVDHDPLASGVHAGVRGTQVDRQVVGKQGEKRA